jgi:hypothetical protein
MPSFGKMASFFFVALESTLCRPGVYPLSPRNLPFVAQESTLCRPGIYPSSSLSLPLVTLESTPCHPGVYPLSPWSLPEGRLRGVTNTQRPSYEETLL